jgi:hypothetical protein
MDGCRISNVIVRKDLDGRKIQRAVLEIHIGLTVRRFRIAVVDGIRIGVAHVRGDLFGRINRVCLTVAQYPILL